MTSIGLPLAALLCLIPRPPLHTLGLSTAHSHTSPRVFVCVCSALQAIPQALPASQQATLEAEAQAAIADENPANLEIAAAAEEENQEIANEQGLVIEDTKVPTKAETNSTNAGA